MEVTICCNLIIEVASYHFCCVIFVRKKLLGLAPIKKERISQAWEYQEVGILGSHFRSYLPHPLQHNLLAHVLAYLPSHYGKTRCNSSVVYEKKIHKDMITLVGLFTLQKSQTLVKEKAVDQGPKWTFGTF